MNLNFVFFEAILSPCQNTHFKKRFATSGFNLYTIYERIERSFHTISQIPSEYHVFSNDIIYASITGDEDIYAKG